MKLAIILRAGGNLGLGRQSVNDCSAGVHDRAPAQGRGAVDALSDVSRVTRLAGGVFLEAEFTAPSRFDGKVSADHCKPFLVAPRHVIASHFIVGGRMLLRVGGGGIIEVRAGELVLLPHNDVHSFGSDLYSAAIPAHEVIRPPGAGGIARVKVGGGGEATQMLCGFLGSETSFSPLLRHCRRC